MTQLPLIVGDCDNECPSVASAEAMNRDCFCIGVDRDALHAEVEAVLRAHGLSASLADSHPHLFSSWPVFVSPRHIAEVARVAVAIEEVVATAAYRSAVLAWAPPIASFEPGSAGGLLGLDFHLGVDGPRLIEVNTNPGGVLLNALMARAQRCCLPETGQSLAAMETVEDSVLEVLRSEWRLQRGDAPLRTIAIVDEAPEAQFLYPEFLLFRQLLQRHGYRAEVCDPGRLVARDGALWLGPERVDLVYNRLTDFALDAPAHAVLRAAYLSADVALSPHPRAHSLYADKRNLSLLGNGRFLEAAGVGAASRDILTATVPRTVLLSAENREELWNGRRQWFFKPAAGFGSKASYRGDKLTKRVWAEIAQGCYVAQQIVAPSERHLATDASPLKVDLRCYAYQGEVLLHAARMYQGQTTNFRTPGGGFAPVLSGWAG